MKKLTLILALATMMFGFASCGDNDDYMVFVGTWGVETIQYYNIDYNGNPIGSTIETYNFTPGDTEDGIDLVFKSDRSGKMVDRSRDTLFYNYDANHIPQDTIPCVDTVIVTTFTYSYHKDDQLLYMNMEVAHPFTYMMKIPDINDKSFTYINEYDKDYVEKAKLVRISDGAKGQQGNRIKPVSRPRREGSLLSAY